MGDHPAWSETLVPVTSEIGFLNRDEPAVSDWYFSTKAPRTDGRRWKRSTVRGNLLDVLSSLAPLTTLNARRFLFVPCRGGWTAYFDNQARGADAFLPVSHGAEALQCLGLRVRLKRSPLFEARLFELFGPDRTDFLNRVRAILVTKSRGRWRFEEAGAPLSFEDVLTYKSRRVQDRLTPDMLREYAASLGVFAFDEGFYAPERGSVLVELAGPPFPNACHLSLSEAQAALEQDP